MRLPIFASLAVVQMLAVTVGLAQEASLTVGVNERPWMSDKEINAGFIAANRIFSGNGCGVRVRKYGDAIQSKFPPLESNDQFAEVAKLPGKLKIVNAVSLWSMSVCEGNRSYSVTGGYNLPVANGFPSLMECTPSNQGDMIIASAREEFPTLLIRGVAHLAGLRDAAVLTDAVGKVASPIPVNGKRSVQLEWPEISYLSRKGNRKGGEPDEVFFPAQIKITRQQCDLLSRWARSQ